MEFDTLQHKLKILTDAAKYDASCSSSGSRRSHRNGGVGNAAESGICHSWSEDGRCISLLKILLTNKCIYNCEYCVNRSSNDVERAEFTPEEVCELTLNFYKRNYIEGLFLSSGIVGNADHTMEKLIRVARLLRYRENFNGYIHMKAIPGASPALVEELGRLVDRLSVNIELPTESALALLAPQKSFAKIFQPMTTIRQHILESRSERKTSRHAPLFAPAGQSTQMIVGASREDDRTIIQRAQALYHSFDLKRVYYSSFVPVASSRFTEGIVKPPLLREHRIYQADFLMRYYDFTADEILTAKEPFFDLELDPKMCWAIRHLDRFPVEINRADLEELIRIPGIGITGAKRIIRARRFAKLKYDDLRTLKISTKRARHFMTVAGVYRGAAIRSRHDLRQRMKLLEGSPRYEQMDLFAPC